MWYAHRNTNRLRRVCLCLPCAGGIYIAILAAQHLGACAASAQPKVFSVRDYGAQGTSSRISTQGSIANGSTKLMCLDCSFRTEDVGKKIYIYGASSARYALSLGTEIRAVESPTIAMLSSASTQSSVRALVQIVGTDDTAAIVAARNAACAAASALRPSLLAFPGPGVYTTNRVLEPCSHLEVTGPGTLLQTAIAQGNAAGQGSSAIVFPASKTGRWCAGGTMQRGSAALKYGSQGDHPCNFLPADVGASVVVQYAGPNHLPLDSHITRYISDREVNLDRVASVSVPVTNSGFDKVGTFVHINTTAISDVEIDHLTIVNVATAYPPGRTLGMGIIAFGADNSSLKRDIRVHDITVITASNNCLGGNNGFLDGYALQRNTLIGCADVAIYVAGWNSRGVISENEVKNANFPGIAPKTMARMLQMGMLVKNASNVTIADNDIQIDTDEGGIMFGDHPQFGVEVSRNHLRMTAPNHYAVVGIGGNTGDHLRLTANNIECNAPGKGIWFYSDAVTNIEATGNTIRNCAAAIKFERRSGDTGPSGLTLVANHIYGCHEGIRLQDVGGVNLIERNTAQQCSGTPWMVLDSPKGAATYFTSDNISDNPTHADLDGSVRIVTTGAAAHSNP